MLVYLRKFFYGAVRWKYSGGVVFAFTLLMLIDNAFSLALRSPFLVIALSIIVGAAFQFVQRFAGWRSKKLTALQYCACLIVGFLWIPFAASTLRYFFEGFSK